jgi:hypothetical protein
MMLSLGQAGARHPSTHRSLTPEKLLSLLSFMKIKGHVLEDTPELLSYAYIS